MSKRSNPTVDDYSRLLDDISQRIVDLIVSHERAGKATAMPLREVQAYINAQRSKRGL